MTQRPMYLSNAAGTTAVTVVPGNAVTPPAARDLIFAVVEALTGEEVAR